MRYREIIGGNVLTEGADLSCRTCGEHLGKATECDNPQYCGTCGDRTPNPHGERSSYAPFASTTRVKPAPVKAAVKPAPTPKDAHRASRAAKYTTSVEDNTWALIDGTVYRTSSTTGRSDSVGTVKATRVRIGGEPQAGFEGIRSDGTRKLFASEKSAVAWVRSIDIRRTKAATK